ncbi:hypothetical protein [Cryobacterium sp. N21]|uniref:hypothetical protein n=1 Tax=Cryobacterium sp. N21 TaxID=2048289 RepID=UPI000CE4CF43|nr:hypothetical protein [Cryobacterium sp. N21]
MYALIRRACAFVALLACFGALLVFAPQRAEALTGSEFNPGNIISDAQFYASDAMSQDQIQAFLDAQIGTCQNSFCLNVLRIDTTNTTLNFGTCAPYPGEANESAARMIFKVQRACSISAKVLLVTLQKEQGLVTSKAPTEAVLRKALGQGCPDTAACDSTYYGFFMQVYSAARQFAWYGNPAGSHTSIKVGQSNAVRFHPEGCGSSNVVIQNRATAALYYYTPYQPNAAALSNLGGTGDSCSSYGNRNFWVYFNNWFGSSVTPGTTLMSELYRSQGGGSGWMGAASSALTEIRSNGGGLRQGFVNGSIYWSQGGGARIVSGAILTEYLEAQAESGSLGWPTGPVTESTANGGGQSQTFQNGAIFWTVGAGARIVSGGIGQGFLSGGSMGGFLGWPISDANYDSANGSGMKQVFQGGEIFWNASTGPRIVSGAILTTYHAVSGQSGLLGWPSSGVVQIGANGGGQAQAFQNGSIYWTSAAGARVVTGNMLPAYFGALGEGGVLGWPTSDVMTVSVRGGGTAQNFQMGTILASSSTGVRVVSGAVSSAYGLAGGVAGALGWPTSNLISSTANGGGTAQAFQDGSIYSSGAGAFPVSGPIRSFYFSLLGEGGALGWPTSVQTCVSATSCTQSFQNGAIDWSSSDGASLGSVPQIATAHAALGGSTGELGRATSVVVTISANGGGLAQAFEKGSIYWSSSRGAFAVTGPIRNAYWSALGEGGNLGFPAGPATTVSANGGGLGQSFQGGSIYWSAAGGAHAVSGNIRDAYVAAAGETGKLGWPTSDLVSITANGGGTAQAFQGGSIYAAAGARGFPVNGPIRSYYWSQLGEAGLLGFPTAVATCGLSDGGCSQTFTGGTIYWSSSTGARTVMPQIDAAYAELGGATGSLGSRIGGLQQSSANGGGVGQGFEGGSIYWSAGAGAFAVTDAIRDFYWSQLGEAGTLGWPTAAAVCGLAEGACSQTFQSGSIYWSPSQGARLG